MNREELLTYIDHHKLNGRSLNARSAKHKDAYVALCVLTSFMDTLGKVPASARIRALREGVNEIPMCSNPTCSNTVGIALLPKTDNEPSMKYFARNCSAACARSSPVTRDLRTKTMIDKYGGHNMQTEKGRAEYVAGVRAKYGVDNPNQTAAVVEKGKRTRSAWTDEKKSEIRAKREATWGEKYEGGIPMRDPSVINKIKSRNMEKYGRVNPTQQHISDESMRILTDKEALQKLYDECGYLADVADQLDVHFSSVQRACSRLGVKVNHSHMTSRAELEICSLLDDWGVTYEHGRRDILSSGYEIDIFIPDMKVGIEYNGVHWHSEVFRDKNYHQDKALDAMEQGIQLIQVWEGDWKNTSRKDIVINKIKAKLGIDQQRVFARKTKVVHPAAVKAREFFNQNHIQGHVSCRVIGLEYEGELVAVMGMKRIGSEEEGCWDLVRYATSKSVVGGLSKLLSHFKKENTVNHIVTYAHLDYSHGKAYEAVGFTKEHVTVAGMFYVKGETRYRREKFMKHKLPELLENFDPELTERENMDAHGFKRLYDCGSIKYTWQA